MSWPVEKLVLCLWWINISLFTQWRHAGVIDAGCLTGKLTLLDNLALNPINCCIGHYPCVHYHSKILSYDMDNVWWTEYCQPNRIIIPWTRVGEITPLEIYGGKKKC